MTIGFDSGTPNMARVYDYWLGGKDHYRFFADVRVPAAEAEGLHSVFIRLQSARHLHQVQQRTWAGSGGSPYAPGPYRTRARSGECRAGPGRAVRRRRPRCRRRPASCCSRAAATPPRSARRSSLASWTVSTAPAKITTTNDGTLVEDTSLGTIGACTAKCGEWWYDPRPSTVQLLEFYWDETNGTKVLANNLVPALANNNEWASLGGGTYTPLCLSWVVTAATTPTLRTTSS